MVCGAVRYWEADRVPAPRPPLLKQPLALLTIALTRRAVLLVTGRLIGGSRPYRVGALANTVALVRLRIRDTDYGLRAKKPPK